MVTAWWQHRKRYPGIIIIISNYHYYQALFQKVAKEISADVWVGVFNLDPNVCRIAPKVYWIQSLVGVSHFAEYSENRPVTVCKMLINVLKSPFCNYERNGKVLQNPYSEQINTKN